MDQWLLILIFVASVMALVVVARHFWPKLRNLVDQPTETAPSSEHQADGEQRSYIDMETRQQEDGVPVADLADHQQKQPPTTVWGRFMARLRGDDRKQRQETEQSTTRNKSGLPRGATLLLLLLLIVAVSLGLSLIPGISDRLHLQATYHRLFSQDRFVVLIAPFNDGVDGQTGQNVAEALADELEQQAAGRLVVVTLHNPPADEQRALNIARDYAADVLVWGDVQSGELLDNPTLSPRLIYTPSGAYAPNAWVGYNGRFVMPERYTLVYENTPINGKVVLPPLLMALEDYSNGSADKAYETFGNLLDDTLNPLHPSLPNALRGNTLWARGMYDQAVDTYTVAIENVADPYDQGLLSNNKGAILIDQGNLAAAEEALTRSVQLMNDDTLGELHFNLGLLAQHDGRSDDAVIEFDTARTMLSQNVMVRLALADTYRRAGRLAETETMLKEAERQSRNQVSTVPEALQEALGGYLLASLQEQRGLLGLAQCVDTCGPVAWQMEMVPVQSAIEIAGPRDAVREAVNTSDDLIAQWRGRAAAAEASLKVEQQVDEIETELVGDGQARKLDQDLSRQRYHLALMLIEEERTNYSEEQGILGNLWTNFRGSESNREAEQILRELLLLDPNNLEVLVAYARVSWLRFDFSETAARYDDIRTRVPGAPDGYYGAGILALERGERDVARQWFLQALERNAAFFPARIKLAELAQPQQPDGNWSETLTHLRILMGQYPCTNSAVRLASALRQSGSNNINEAEQVLLGLEEKDADVLLELARISRAKDDPDTAIDYYQQASQAEDPPIAAWVELGEMLVAQGRTEEAVRQFRTAIRWDRDNIPARLALANIYLDNPETYNDADEQYRYVINQEENSPGTVTAPTLLMIGNNLMEHANYRLAKDAFHLGIAQQPTNASLHHRLGSTYLQLEELEGARNHEQRALDLVGQSDQQLRAEILTGIGDIAQYEERFVDAIDAYNQALKINPELLRAYLGLGRVAFKQENWAMAQNHFNRAIQSTEGENDPLTHFWYAEALLRQEQLYEASESYNHVLELQSPSERRPYPDALLGLAQVKRAMNDIPAAEQDVNQAIELRPDYAEALLFKGKMLQERGNIKQALDTYNASIRANDQLFETRYRRGLILLQQQQYGGAAQDMRIATQLQPTNDEVHYWLGRARLGQDQLSQALDAFNRAVELQGEFLAEAQTYQRLVEAELGNRAAGR